MKKLFALLPIAALLVIVACQKNDSFEGQGATPTLPDEEYAYADFEFPENFGFVFNDNPANPVTDPGATLGRVLFYDTKLSLNNAISCGSCHKQAFGFAEPVAVSTGFETRKTTRNSMSIVNPQFFTGYFWDERATNLEDQVIMPVQNHIEMGMEKLGDLEIKLNKVDYYPALFENAFGSPDITAERIQLAMAQFIRSMVSYNSRFDEGMATQFANFTAQELAGRELFMATLHCGSCHSGQNFSGWGSANIGLEMEYEDGGAGELDGQDFMEGMFKIPTLRNVSLTAPYMHDGRFQTLEEVVDHYDSGVQGHYNLDYRLRDFSDPIFSDPFFGFPGGGDFAQLESKPRKLNLTQADKDALVAFMKTLTDQQFIKDPKFADPFRAAK